MYDTPFTWTFITADNAPPRGIVSVSDVTGSGFTVHVSSTKNGVAFFIVAETAASPPSFEDVLRGTAANGTEPAARGSIFLDGVYGNVTGAEASSPTAPTNAASGSAAVTGLERETSFTVFAVVTDAGAFFKKASGEVNASGLTNDTDAFVLAIAEAAAPRNINVTVLSVSNVTTT
jgi:hypothetical protein